MSVFELPASYGETPGSEESVAHAWKVVTVPASNGRSMRREGFFRRPKQARFETDRDPASVTLTVIDQGSANAKPVWVEMGSPTYPTAGQLAELGVASELQERVLTWRRQGQAVEVEWTMQPYSVALARLAW